MRKGIIISFCMLIFAVTVCSALYINISEQKDNIEITETTLLGDRSAAEGITVKVHGESDSWSDNNQWDIAYKVEADSLKEKVQFLPGSTREFSSPNNWHCEISLQSLSYNYHVNTGDSLYSTSMPLDYHPLRKALDDAEKKLKSEESISWEPVKVSDYLSCLPLSIHLADDTPENSVHINTSYDENKRPYDYSYFRIPVPENWIATLSCEKGSSDRITHREIIGPPVPELKSESLQVKNGMYILLDDFDREITLPSDMRGIHYLPFRKTKTDNNFYYLDMDHAFMSHPLEVDSTVVFLEKSADDTELYLVTAEEKKLWLTVLAITADGSLQQVQKTELSEIPPVLLKSLSSSSDPDIALNIDENCLTICLGHGKLIVLVRETPSKEEPDLREYQKVVDVDLPVDDYGELKKLYKYVYFYKDELSVVRKGSRTVIAFPDDAEDKHWGESLNHCMLICEDTEGLVYMGKYECSLGSKNLGIVKHYNAPIEIL